MSDRVYNFSAGPGVLPVSVLEEAQRDLVSYPGVGCSVMEMSHRSKPFIRIAEEAEANLRKLLAIPDNYRILFLQGGSRLQFSMIPMNLLAGQSGPATYILTGSWGKYALAEAKKAGATAIAWDGAATNYDRLPTDDQLQIDPTSAYVHYTSNETIQGVQFATEPAVGSVPLVCDTSSDFLSRPLDVTRYGLIYACAQKNAGPAGLTMVIIRDDLLERSQDTLPGMLNYRLHAENDSAYNTPPCFSIYITMLITRWLLDEIGGLEAMARLNEQKATLLYDVLDRSEGFYQGHAAIENRSMMNVTFRLPTPELEKAFLEQAEARTLIQLKGHRSVGGIRASIYNAMPVAGVEALRGFMLEFQQLHAGQAASK